MANVVKEGSAKNKEGGMEAQRSRNSEGTWSEIAAFR